MAVAVDVVTYGESNNNQNPTISHAGGASADSVMAIIQKTRPSDVSTVTYGGTSMVQIGTLAPDNFETEIWGLANLGGLGLTGTRTLQINATGTTFAQFTLVITFTGTHATTTSCFPAATFRSASSNTAVASASTLTVSSAAGDLVIDGIGVHTDPGTDKAMAQGADQTELDERFDGVFSEYNIAASRQDGAASVAMDYSWASSTNVTGYRYVAVNVVQAAAAGARPHLMNLLGVGY